MPLSKVCGAKLVKVFNGTIKQLYFNTILTIKLLYMTGEDLKMKLRTTGHSITELAGKLGMSQQNLSQALNAKDIKTGLLEDLAKVLDVPITFFYEGTKFEAERKALETSDKDREISYLRGQVSAYEKALGMMRNEPIEKANVG